MFTQLKTLIRCEILRWKVQRLDKRTRELRQDLAEMHNDFNQYCEFETGRQERLRQHQSKNRQDMTVSTIDSIKLNQESVGGNHHE